MSKIEMLRLLITRRLTAAAEEIFAVFGETVADLEEENSRLRAESVRHRRRAELSARPRVELRRGGVTAVRGGATRAGDSEHQDVGAVLVRDAEFGEDTTLLHIKDEEEEEETLLEDSPPLVDSSPELFQSVNEHVAELPLQLGILAPPTGSDLGEGCSDGQSVAPLADVLDSYAHRGHWAKRATVHRKNIKPEQPYICDICGKKLTRFDGYQKHRRVHTGEKPYACGECGRQFSVNSNYRRHIRLHAGQKKLRNRGRRQQRRAEDRGGEELRTLKVMRAEDDGDEELTWTWGQ